MSEGIKIFLSVGTICNDQQEKFVQNIEKHLQENGIIPQTLGRTYFSSQQPLIAIRDLMANKCYGTIVLAFENMHLIEAIEKRGSPEESRWQAVNLPTVWNQLEALMAYMMDYPLLVIVEKNLKYEGLLESGYDWYVKKVNLEDDILTDPEFVGMFADWVQRVQDFHLFWVESSTEQDTPIGQFPPIAQNPLVNLRQILADRFSPGDLETLCFDLDIPYEDLSGDEHRLKSLHLVQHLDRTNRIDELIKVGQVIRPDITWSLT
ncbi:MAG: hypothetical protein IAF02_27150 [Anaerolineae bacterium]|nr:hypothetical protein [Anaerolineae bacterium]